jgi:LacI family transcriptional regulator
LSEATVDRVLNDRGGVRASTVAEVRQAVQDLDRQRAQLRLGGRTFMVDLMIDAPAQFSDAVRGALEAELPALRPAVMRARFHLFDGAPVTEVAATLDRLAARSSHGVILKAPDVPEVAHAITRLARKGIPVVTLVTDVQGSARAAYVGIDNRAAGATAAYLVGQWLGREPGNVMVIRSSSSFRGEDEREIGFRTTFRTAFPQRAQVDVIDEDGTDKTLHDRVAAALSNDPSIHGVYSMYSRGGGNGAVLDAFADQAVTCSVFLAHDLTDDNSALLRSGRLSAVLHHDLHQDMRRACHAIMQAQGALPGAIRAWQSGIQVITPYNPPVS